MQDRLLLSASSPLLEVRDLEELAEVFLAGLLRLFPGSKIGIFLGTQLWKSNAEGHSSFKDPCQLTWSKSFGQSAGHVDLVKVGELDADALSLADYLAHIFDLKFEYLQMQKKVSESSRSKSAFIANTSHEIRTPLNALLGFCEILSRSEIDQGTKNQLHQRIQSNGHELVRVIDEILDFSTLASGRAQIQRLPTHLRTLFHQTYLALHAPAERKGLRLEFNLADDLPAVVETDPARLKQILNSVIGNAVKFTMTGKIIVDVKKEGAGSFFALHVWVADTGIGISESKKERIFEPFSQADESASRRFGGTGLGLATARRLAHELGGDLTLVSSQESEGSIFHLKFQVKVVSQVSQDAEPSLSNRRILVVEDSIDNQEFFLHFLMNAGARVNIAGDGFEAVREARLRPYDVILMDIQLPGLDGREATRRIRRQGYRGPIIAVTAHASPDERRSCLEAGCTGHIAKPVSGQDLIAEIAAYLLQPSMFGLDLLNPSV